MLFWNHVDLIMYSEWQKTKLQVTLYDNNAISSTAHARISFLFYYNYSFLSNMVIYYLKSITHREFQIPKTLIIRETMRVH